MKTEPEIVTMERLSELASEAAQGHSHREIADAVGMARATVAQALIGRETRYAGMKIKIINALHPSGVQVGSRRLTWPITYQAPR